MNFGRKKNVEVPHLCLSLARWYSWIILRLLRYKIWSSSTQRWLTTYHQWGHKVFCHLESPKWDKVTFIIQQYVTTWTNLWWRFRKNMWPSQNIWTLLGTNSIGGKPVNFKNVFCHLESPKWDKVTFIIQQYVYFLMIKNVWKMDFIAICKEFFLRISALASKKRSDQKNIGTLYH